jgi:hypothetical protein
MHELPPQLLLPPLFPRVLAKTAVEGFVASPSAPYVPEDKERKHPITNASVRKLDVLFFVQLAHSKLQHNGTLQYCYLCFKHQDLYRKCTGAEKGELLINLVRYVRASGGRFLEWDDKRKLWYEIGDVRAAQKTLLGLSGKRPVPPTKP